MIPVYILLDGTLFNFLSEEENLMIYFSYSDNGESMTSDSDGFVVVQSHDTDQEDSLISRASPSKLKEIHLSYERVVIIS